MPRVWPVRWTSTRAALVASAFGKLIERTPLPNVTFARIASTAQGSGIERCVWPVRPLARQVADSFLSLPVDRGPQGEAAVIGHVDADVLRRDPRHGRHDHELALVLEDVDGDGGRNLGSWRGLLLQDRYYPPLTIRPSMCSMADKERFEAGTEDWWRAVLTDPSAPH